MNTPFDLEEFSKENWARNFQVFKQSKAPNEYWITAMVEELGEIAGAVKKIARGFNERELKKTIRNWELCVTDGSTLPDNYEEKFKANWLIKKKADLASEAADLFIYLDLFCTANDIDLPEAIKYKFNLVSKEMGCPKYEI